MRRILIGVIVLGVLLLVGFIIVSSSCGGSATEEELPERPSEPTRPPAPPSSGDDPGVQATVEAQVQQTVEAQAGVRATAVAEAVATLSPPTPEPSPTAQASVESRVPVFRRTPEPALLATVAPTPTIMPTPTAGPWPTVQLPAAVDDPDAATPPPESGLPSGELAWYRHKDNSFLIYHPEEWEIVADESSARFQEADRLAELTVEVFQVPPDTELSEFLEQRLVAGGIEAREWLEYPLDFGFDLVAFRSWPAYLADYQRLVDEVTCEERVRAALFVSQIPLADLGFQVTLTACAPHWETYAVYWDDMMDHFQEGAR